MKLIKWNSLEQLFCHTTIYVPDVVREFHANWNPAITNPRSRWYNKVWVRGNFYNFSPEAINYFLHYQGGDNVVDDEPSWDEKEHDMDLLAYILTEGAIRE